MKSILRTLVWSSPGAAGTGLGVCSHVCACTRVCTHTCVFTCVCMHTCLRTRTCVEKGKEGKGKGKGRERGREGKGKGRGRQREKGKGKRRCKGLFRYGDMAGGPVREGGGCMVGG